MTIKLDALADWKNLSAQSAIIFDGPKGSGARRVRLHVNCEADTVFYYQDYAGEDRLLTAVSAGVHTLEFYAEGKVGVFRAGKAQVWYQTAEDQPTFVKVVDPKVFTKIAQRRERNPELERMFAMMQRNAMQREAQLQADFARRLDAVQRANVAPAPVPAPKKKGKSDGSPAPKADGTSGGDGKGQGAPGNGGEAPKADDKS